MQIIFRPIFYTSVMSGKWHLLATKSPLVNSLGLGALKGHLDLDSPVFDELKKFLTQMK